MPVKKTELLSSEYLEENSVVAFGENEVDKSGAPGQDRVGNGGQARILQGRNHENAVGVVTCPKPGVSYFDKDGNKKPQYAGSDAPERGVRDGYKDIRVAYLERARKSGPNDPPTLYLPVDEEGRSSMGTGVGGFPESMRELSDAEMARTEAFSAIVDEHLAKGDLGKYGYNELIVAAERRVRGETEGRQASTTPAVTQDMDTEQEVQARRKPSQEPQQEGSERKKRSSAQEQQSTGEQQPDRDGASEMRRKQREFDKRMAQQGSDAAFFSEMDGTPNGFDEFQEREQVEGRPEPDVSASALWDSYLEDIQARDEAEYERHEREDGTERVVEHRFKPQQGRSALVAEGKGHYTQASGPEGITMQGRSDGSIDINVDEGNKLNVLCSSKEEMLAGQSAVVIDATQMGPDAPNHDVRVGPPDKKVTFTFSAGGEIKLSERSEHLAIEADIEFNVNGPDGAIITAQFSIDDEGRECLHDKDTGVPLKFNKEQGGYQLEVPEREQDSPGQEQEEQEQEVPSQERDGEGQDLGDDGFEEAVPSADLPKRKWDELSEEERQAARESGADKLHLDNPYEDYEDIASLDQGLGGTLEESEQEDKFANISPAQLGKGMAEMEFVADEDLRGPDAATNPEHKRGEGMSVI